MKLRCLALVFLPVLAFAQNPAATPAADGNYLQNGKFEKFTPQDNVWDGVDSGGFLAGFQGGTDIIQEGGKVGRTPMATGVQADDLNGDGLIDLMTVDAAGYFRVYFNKGTKNEPKFGQGEFVPIFLRRIRVASSAWSNLPKFALADLARSGALDLFIGNYVGQLLLIKNTGNRSVPEWKQPAKFESSIVPTAGDGKLWSNLLSPFVYDWNHDGKLDVIVGEGAYSANAVHLLLNEGSNAAPKFSEDARAYLAYGDGREQLVPTVVDYNGDGHPDLLVGDRMGSINVYLSSGPWKNGDELKLQESPVMFGSAKTISWGGVGAKCVAPAVADLNGDGLFDIIVGEPNGRIAYSYNTGTPTAPKFGPLVEFKGEDVLKRDTIRKPANWEAYFGELDGNFYAASTVVTPEEDSGVGTTESKQVFKFQYFPSQNQIIRKPPTIFPGIAKSNEHFTGIGSGFSTVPSLRFNWHIIGIDFSGWHMDSNYLLLRQKIDAGLLKPNTNYKLSFKVKGNGIKDSAFRFSITGWVVKSGNAKDSMITGTAFQQGDFPVPPGWSSVTRTVNVRFEKEKTDLNTGDKWANSGGRVEYRGMLEIRAGANVDSAVMYIDDVRLTPQ